MKREESPPLSNDKDAFGGGTEESGSEGETGRSLATVETMNVRPEMGRARAEFFMVFQESPAPSFWRVHNEHEAHFAFHCLVALLRFWFDFLCFLNLCLRRRGCLSDMLVSAADLSRFGAKSDL